VTLGGACVVATDPERPNYVVTSIREDQRTDENKKLGRSEIMIRGVQTASLPRP